MDDSGGTFIKVHFIYSKKF